MSMTQRQETARIYQFPVKGRTPSPEPRLAPHPRETCPVVTNDFGSGWYHEAAMQDADQGRKH